MSIEQMTRVWKMDKTDLPPTQTLVLLALADHADDAGICQVSARTLATMICRSRPCLFRALAALEDRGLLERAPRYDKRGGRTSNVYRLHVPPSHGESR